MKIWEWSIAFNDKYVTLSVCLINLIVYVWSECLYDLIWCTGNEIIHPYYMSKLHRLFTLSLLCLNTFLPLNFVTMSKLQTEHIVFHFITRNFNVPSGSIKGLGIDISHWFCTVSTPFTSWNPILNWLERASVKRNEKGKQAQKMKKQGYQMNFI